MRRRVLIEKGWAIAGPFGLYAGWWMTRKAAIEAHVTDKVISSPGHTARYTALDIWKMCKREGDRAVRVAIKYEDVK